MRGVPRRGGGSLPQFIFAEVLMQEGLCTAYSPLSCAALGHPPLINEGGKKMPFCIEKAPILDESVLLRQIEGTGVGRSGSKTSFTSNRSSRSLGECHIR